MMSTQLLSSKNKGKLFVVSAPSGTGKDTLVNKLLEEFSDITESISYTTREPRPGEIDGKNYYFVSEEEFKQKIAADDFLEYANFVGCYYGTCRKVVDNILDQGKHVVMVIETKGAKQLMKKCNAVFIFINPPSIEELERRLRGRHTEDEEHLQRRLAKAKEEMGCAHLYHYEVINDDLEQAYQVFKSIFIAESHRINPLEF